MWLLKPEVIFVLCYNKTRLTSAKKKPMQKVRIGDDDSRLHATQLLLAHLLFFLTLWVKKNPPSI